MATSSRLRRLADDCDPERWCPAVDATDHGTLVFTGPVVRHADLRRGPGEQSVELSIDLVREALDALDAR